MPGQKRKPTSDGADAGPSSPTKARRPASRNKTAPAVAFPIGFTDEELQKLRERSGTETEYQKNLSSDITHLAYKSLDDFDCLASYFGIVANTYFVRSTWLSSRKQSFHPEAAQEFALKQIDVNTHKAPEGKFNVKELLHIMQSREGIKKMFGDQLFNRALIVGDKSLPDYIERRYQLQAIIEVGGGLVRGDKNYEDFLRQPEDMCDFASIIILLNDTNLEDVGLSTLMVQRALNSRLPIVREECIKTWIRQKAGPITHSKSMETAAKYWRDVRDPAIQLTDEAFEWAAFGRGHRLPDMTFMRMGVARVHIIPSNVRPSDNTPPDAHMIDISEIEREIEENKQNMGHRGDETDQFEDQRDPAAVVILPARQGPSNSSNKPRTHASSTKPVAVEYNGLAFRLDDLKLFDVTDATWMESKYQLKKIVKHHRNYFVPTSTPRACRNENLNAEYLTDDDMIWNFHNVIDNDLRVKKYDSEVFSFAVHDLMMEISHSLSPSYVPHTYVLSFLVHHVAMINFKQQANLQACACRLLSTYINHYPTAADGVRRLYWLKAFSQLPPSDSPRKRSTKKRTLDHNIELRVESFRSNITHAFTKQSDGGPAMRRLILQLLDMDLYCMELDHVEKKSTIPIQKNDGMTSGSDDDDHEPSTPLLAPKKEALSGTSLAALIFIDHINTRKRTFAKKDRDFIMEVVRLLSDNQTDHVLVDQCISFLIVCFEALRHFNATRPISLSDSPNSIPFDLQHDFTYVLHEFRKYGWTVDEIRSFFPITWMKNVIMDEKWLKGTVF